MNSWLFCFSEVVGTFVGGGNCCPSLPSNTIPAKWEIYCSFLLFAEAGFENFKIGNNRCNEQRLFLLVALLCKRLPHNCVSSKTQLGIFLIGQSMSSTLSILIRYSAIENSEAVLHSGRYDVLSGWSACNAMQWFKCDRMLQVLLCLSSLSCDAMIIW